MTSGLPARSHMPIDLFRVGDLVTPTDGALAGRPARVVEVRRALRDMLVLRFDSVVRKYATQMAKMDWGFDPDHVRLEAFAPVGTVWARS